MTLLLVALLFVFFVVGLIVGAYSHKWLQRETGAPSNLTSKNAAGAAINAASQIANNAASAVNKAL